MFFSRRYHEILWMGQQNPNHQFIGGKHLIIFLGFQHVSTIRLVMQDFATIHSISWYLMVHTLQHQWKLPLYPRNVMRHRRPVHPRERMPWCPNAEWNAARTKPSLSVTNILKQTLQPTPSTAATPKSAENPAASAQNFKAQGTQVALVA